MRRLRVLTWQVHGNYMYYLSQAPHEFHVLSRPGRPPGYGGRNGTLPWGANVHDCPVDRVRELDFDCVVYQSLPHFRDDRHHVLSDAQNRLPSLYVEHDPPLHHPTNTVHPVADAGLVIVHVTRYNALMWDCGASATSVIEHGVKVPAAAGYRGDVPRGVAVINHLSRRGRRLGADVFEAWRARVPLELFGMDAQSAGGRGELPYAALLTTIGSYRFFAHPVRYTSLALAVCEAMMIGMPIVGLATTELPRILAESGGGFAHTDVAQLADASLRLLESPDEARRLGRAAQAYARERFGIERFVADWNRVLAQVA